MCCKCIIVQVKPLIGHPIGKSKDKTKIKALTMAVRVLEVVIITERATFPLPKQKDH